MDTEKTPLRVGVINWDNSLPPETYFGLHASRVQSPEKVRTRVPYYAEVTDAGVRFHEKTAEEVDRELSLAISAGIDYFAYCWYSEESWTDTPERLAKGSVEPYLHELNHTRKLHAESPLREKIKQCAILICMHWYSDRDFELLAQSMLEPWYEKVDGRPLVCLFGGYYPDYIERLRAFPEKYGTADPYIVFHNACERYDGGDYSGADAVCSYACCGTNMKSYVELSEFSLSANTERTKYGVPALPHFTMGWDPTPRIDVPVPWVTYPETDYAPDASEEEFLAEAASFAGWIDAHRGSVVQGRIHVFAWNEFEEGGWICPTHAVNGGTDSARLEAFRKIASLWKERF